MTYSSLINAHFLTRIYHGCSSSMPAQQQQVRPSYVNERDTGNIGFHLLIWLVMASLPYIIGFKLYV